MIVTMMNMTVDQLVGVWKSDDGRCVMWIGNDMKYVMVTYDNESIISETIIFSYDEARNVCIISDSVILNQLFADGGICIKVFYNNQQHLLVLSKRG